LDGQISLSVGIWVWASLQGVSLQIRNELQSSPSMRSVRLVVTACVCVSCAGVQYRADTLRVRTLSASATAQGLSMPELLALSYDTKEKVRFLVQSGATPLERMRALNRFLREKQGRDFQYNASLTLDAQSSWDAGQGDCLSYAHLFNALGRSVDLPLRYVRYRTAVSVEERDGHLLVTSHIASLFSDSQIALVVELSGRAPSFWGADFRVIEDDEAWALHYTNEAVQLLGQGQSELAEKKLRFLMTNVPRVSEVAVNLTALLLRSHRFDEAYTLSHEALKTHQDSVPLHLNAAAAAHALGKTDEAQRLLATAKATAVDPFVFLAEGIALFERQKYREAQERFDAAARRSPKVVVFAAWRARAQLKQGRHLDAWGTLDQMLNLDATHPLVTAVRGELSRASVERRRREAENMPTAVPPSSIDL
jgi:Flp pilus assembly protein TadD